MTYDSHKDTIEHICTVQTFMMRAEHEWSERMREHDQSKLCEPEKSIFDKYTPLLKGCTYNSDEYKQYLAEMKPALDHHYAENSHHPEHYPDGVNGMSLLDLREMLCDWKAATARHADGSMLNSLRLNRKRFDIPDNLFIILVHTAHELQLITTEDAFALLHGESAKEGGR